MELKKEKLLKLIEPHFEKDLVLESYEVNKQKASKLLTHTRFDLAFKLLYLDMMDKNVNFAREIYTEHIRAFNLGKFIEPGNEEKNTIDKFIKEFHKTFEDIKANGFDSTKTLIPISKNASIANGAHRIASAVYLKKDVEYVQIDTDDHIYDYKFFYSRNVTSELLDIVATKFVEHTDNVHIAFIWPTAKGHDDEIENIIPNIIYRREIELNSNGAHNLLSQIYYGEEWLGTVEDDFKGSKGKLVECFKTFDPVRIIAFQAENLDEVLKIKDNVRDIFNVGKHSIHITDTKEEAIRVAQVVFNKNSIHFLNNAKPNKFIDTYKKLDKYKTFLDENKLFSDDVVMDSNVILSVYGLKEAKDIDFFCFDNSKITKNFEDINIHDEELKYYDEDKNELLYNPQNYFYFNNLKFISFNQLYKMKKNRAEEKDINDCKMMEALLENNKIKELFNKLKQELYYTKIKVRVELIKSLKKIGIFEFIKRIVRSIK